jgi:flagellar motor switch protein FliM
MGEKFGRDSIWESHLASELWVTDIELDAVLDEQVMSLEHIMNLRVGDTLMLNATPSSNVELRCGGIPMMVGSMGRAGNQIAIQVERTLKNLGEN